jgi:2-oxoglutarate ferredoxin oxidoreductase subunit delta
MKYWRTPLDLKEVKLTKGKVYIIADRCKGCQFCVEYCPRGVLEMSEEFNVKGYHPPEAVNEENCVSCHFCEVLCPEFAIFAVTEDDNEAA